MNKYVKIVAVLVAVVMLFAMVACSGGSAATETKPATTNSSTTSSGSDNTAADNNAAPAGSETKLLDKTYKIAWIGWGDMDYVGGGITEYCRYLDANMPEIEFVYSDAGLRGPDAMVAEAEALCQSGVDAIIAYLPSAAMADVCKKYGVWLGAGTNLVSDQELLNYLDNSGIWLGYAPHGNEKGEGAAAAEYMYNLGDRNFVVIATDPGHPAGDARLAGALEFLQSKDDVKILGTYQGSEGAQGLADLLALHGNNIQAVVKTSSSQLHSVEGAVAALASAGVDAHLAVTDVCENAAEFFDAGTLTWINGGDQIDAGIMVIPALNALTGHYEGPVYLYPNYLRQYSHEDCDEFDKWIAGDVPAFTADELRQFIKEYNPDATNAAYKDYIESNFTIESVAERHAGLVK